MIWPLVGVAAAVMVFARPMSFISLFLQTVALLPACLTSEYCGNYVVQQRALVKAGPVLLLCMGQQPWCCITLSSCNKCWSLSKGISAWHLNDWSPFGTVALLIACSQVPPMVMYSKKAVAFAGLKCTRRVPPARDCSFGRCMKSICVSCLN